MIVAIDGTAGSGKSTLATRLAQDLSFVNLNSGNLYRAISFKLIQNGISPDKQEDVLRFSEALDLVYNPDSTVTAGGERIDNASLHSSEVDKVTNIIASYRQVRLKVNSVLNSFAKGNDVVCEGRDICSVVFPNADLRFYIDASIEVRAKRRSMQFGDDYRQVLASLEERDFGDRNRPFGALVHTEGEICIDTDNMDANQVYGLVYAAVKDKMERLRH